MKKCLGELRETPEPCHTSDVPQKCCSYRSFSHSFRRGVPHRLTLSGMRNGERCSTLVDMRFLRGDWRPCEHDVWPAGEAGQCLRERVRSLWPGPQPTAALAYVWTFLWPGDSPVSPKTFSISAQRARPEPWTLSRLPRSACSSSVPSWLMRLVRAIFLSACSEYVRGCNRLLLLTSRITGLLLHRHSARSTWKYIAQVAACVGTVSSR